MKTTLTEADWRAVFVARRQSKQGRPLSDGERDLLAAAHSEDGKRYGAMDDDVFNATAPFGSTARRGKKGNAP